MKVKSLPNVFGSIWASINDNPMDVILNGHQENCN
jgi:hypothetical protein